MKILNMNERRLVSGGQPPGDQYTVKSDQFVPSEQLSSQFPGVTGPGTFTLVNPGGTFDPAFETVVTQVPGGYNVIQQWDEWQT